MSYQLHPTQAAFAIRTMPSAGCTLNVELLDLDDGEVGRVGGVAIIDTSLALPDEIGEQVWAVFTWDPAVSCPVLTASGATGRTVYRDTNYTSWEGSVCIHTQEYILGYFQPSPPSTIVTSHHWLRAYSNGMTDCDSYHPQTRAWHKCEWKTPVSAEVPSGVLDTTKLPSSLPGTTTFYGIRP